MARTRAGLRRTAAAIAMGVAVLTMGVPTIAAADKEAPAPPGPIGDPTGNGAWPAIAESRADAPGYTIYRPADMPAEPLPLVLWGNGGCRDAGLTASHFLREIASHGYVIVANGAPRGERPVKTGIPGEDAVGAPAPTLPLTPPRREPDETSTGQLLAAIDWAAAANGRTGDDLEGHVDTTRIAVMGHSCGGLQALQAGADPRVDTVVAFASGVYVRRGSGLSGVDITKADLVRLHTPVAYVLGGPTDIAYANGMDDFDRIGHVPVMAASIPVGHDGTLSYAAGGDWALVGTAWLDWQLKQDEAARHWFVGPDCRLCVSPEWTIQRKNFPETP